MDRLFRQAGPTPLLIVAHPGHELRLFRWMEQRRPVVLALTDGSGGQTQSRADWSRRAIASAGGSAGEFFAPATDQAWYATLLAGEPSLFDATLDAVIAEAVSQSSTLIVTDAVDGYNPMHDLCEALGAAAVRRLARRGVAVEHLVSRAIAGGDEDGIVDIQRLDAAALSRKQEAVDAYAPLAQEAARLLSEEPDALAVERLRRPRFDWPADWSPQWEEIGRERVAGNHYLRPIEYRAHVLPMARAMIGDDSAGEFEDRRACAS